MAPLLQKLTPKFGIKRKQEKATGTRTCLSKTENRNVEDDFADYIVDKIARSCPDFRGQRLGNSQFRAGGVFSS
jgi:hypothetical protein